MFDTFCRRTQKQTQQPAEEKRSGPQWTSKCHWFHKADPGGHKQVRESCSRLRGASTLRSHDLGVTPAVFAGASACCGVAQQAGRRAAPSSSSGTSSSSCSSSSFRSWSTTSSSSSHTPQWEWRARTHAKTRIHTHGRSLSLTVWASLWRMWTLTSHDQAALTVSSASLPLCC